MRPLLCVLAMLASMLATPAPAHDKLRLVADNWPPFTDASMPGGGLATSIVSTALARAGYPSAVEEAPWARALLGVSEGRYDVLINAWYNDARANIGQFSEAYLTNRIRLLQRKGEAFRFTRQSDLYPTASPWCAITPIHPSSMAIPACARWRCAIFFCGAHVGSRAGELGGGRRVRGPLQPAA